MQLGVLVSTEMVPVVLLGALFEFCAVLLLFVGSEVGWEQADAGAASQPTRVA